MLRLLFQNVCWIFSFLVICSSCVKTDKPGQESLEEVIIKVVQAFHHQDSVAIQQLIHPEKGVMVLFRNGVFNQYTRTDSIFFGKPVPSYFPYKKFETDYKVLFESLPKFDCETMTWSKYGLFCDTSLEDNLLSMTAINLNEYRGDNIPSEEIKTYIELEKQSKRVVLADAQGGELVFYLTLIKNKWYFTIIDRVSSDCSA